jgi:hypothetical protein
MRKLKRKLAEHRRQAAMVKDDSYAASTARTSEPSRRNSATDDDTSLTEIRIKNLERTVSKLKKVRRCQPSLFIENPYTFAGKPK